MEASKTTKLDGNDTTTLSHHPYILSILPLCRLFLFFFVVWWVVVGV